MRSLHFMTREIAQICYIGILTSQLKKHKTDSCRVPTNECIVILLFNRFV